MKIKCIDCDSIATWHYMPGDDNDNDYYCDNHVNRGCSCNMKHYDELDANGDLVPIIGEDGYFVEETDEQGRLLPCCEFDYNEFGYDEFDEDDYFRFLEEHPEYNEF